MSRIVSRLTLSLVVGLTAVATALVAPSTAAPTPSAGSSVSAAAAAPAPNTRVAVRPAVAALLEDAGISAAPINGARAYAFQGTLAVNFPISGTGQGGDRVKHTGGIALRAGGDGITLRRFWIDLDRGRLSGLVNGDARADLFTLVIPSKRPALGQVRLNLTGVAAKALNDTFGVRAFAKGDTFGFATVRS